jgi:hypothetical protein
MAHLVKNELNESGYLVFMGRSYFYSLSINVLRGFVNTDFTSISNFCKVAAPGTGQMTPAIVVASVNGGFVFVLCLDRFYPVLVQIKNIVALMAGCVLKAANGEVGVSRKVAEASRAKEEEGIGGHDAEGRWTEDAPTSPGGAWQW